VSLSPGLSSHEESSIIAAAAAYSTPLFLTFAERLVEAANELESAFPDPWIRSYSLKADPLPWIIAMLSRRGWGANCVSVGEIAAARAAGVPNGAITLEGIGKGNEEFEAVITAASSGSPFRWIAVESLDEVHALTAAFKRQGSLDCATTGVLVRLNPSIEPGTIDGLAVGRGNSKFGTDRAELRAAAQAIADSDVPLQLIGIHLHVGSQLQDLRQWRVAVERSLVAYDELILLGLIRPEVHERRGTLCIGGGVPIGLELADGISAPPRAVDFQRAADSAWLSVRGVSPSKRAIEPGRALVAEATMLVARVLHVRRRHETIRGPLALSGTGESSCTQQVVLDAGMTELMRPALYGARHPIHPIQPDSDTATPTAVHGPICESTDAFGAHLLPIGIERGDLVAIAGAGAYADAMWSPYNSRPRPARLVSAGGTVQVVRGRSLLTS
jgi:diaminopimelate decarboxylase